MARGFFLRVAILSVLVVCVAGSAQHGQSALSEELEVRKGGKGGSGGGSSGGGKSSSSSSASKSSSSTGSYSSATSAKSSTLASKTSTTSTSPSANPKSYSYGKSNVVRTVAPRTYTGTSFSAAKPAYSTQPASRIRPFYAVAGIAGYLAVSRGTYAACSEDEFRFGNRCRVCSSEACPIGQYRVSCSKYNDAYCTLCTNKPGGANYQYTEPGNNNDCAYEECSGDCLEAGDKTVPATAEFIVEMPVTTEEFSGIEARYVGAMAEVASTDISSVRTLEIENGDLADGRALGADRRQQGNTSNTNQTLDGCSNEMPSHTQYVRVLTEVNTTEDKIAQLWESITEYNVAVKFSELCLPPPSLDYQYEESSTFSPSTSAKLPGTTLVWAISLAVLSLVRQ